MAGRGQAKSGRSRSGDGIGDALANTETKRRAAGRDMTLSATGSKSGTVTQGGWKARGQHTPSRDIETAVLNTLCACYKRQQRGKVAVKCVEAVNRTAA